MEQRIVGSGASASTVHGMLCTCSPPPWFGPRTAICSLVCYVQ